MPDSGCFRADVFGFTTTRGAFSGSSTPSILVVDSLDDYVGTPVPGTVRWAMESSGPRFVICEISGVVELLAEINVTDDYMTFCGQTAPGYGLTLQYYGINLHAAHLILQHFRIQPGDTGDTNTGAGVRIGVYDNVAHDIVLMNISTRWTNDESIIVSVDAGDTLAADANVTVWRCLVGEGLSLGPRESAELGKGFAVNYFCWNVAFIQNVSASCGYRMPFAKGGTSGVWHNNLSSDWFNDPAGQFVDPDGTGQFFWSVIGNHYRTGPTWTPNTYAFGSRYAVTGSELHLADNLRDAVGGTLHEFQIIGPDGIDPRVGTAPIAVSGYTPMAAADVMAYLLPRVGCRPLTRDAVDERLIQNITDRTGTSYLTSQDDVGGYAEGAIASDTWTLTPPASPYAVATGETFRTNLEMWSHDFSYIVEYDGAPTTEDEYVISENSSSTLTGVEDSQIVENSPTSNSGGNTTIECANYTAGTYRNSLIRFDVSGIPDDSIVADATMELYVTSTDGATAHEITVSVVKRAWTEYGVTWNTYDGSNNWTTPGGTDTTNDIEAIDVGVMIVPRVTGVYYAHNDAAFTAYVQDRVTAGLPVTLHLRRTDAFDDGEWTTFASSQGTDGTRPKLTVAIEVDTPSGIVVKVMQLACM